MASLLNEVVRRVTGQGVAQVFAAEIAAPLRLDMWIGLPAGRIGFAHPESGTAVAYVANTMLAGPPGPNPRWTWMGELAKAVGA